MNWFSRHLNVTLVISWLIGFPLLIYNEGYRIGFEFFIPMFTEPPQGQVKVTEKILELIS